MHTWPHALTFLFFIECIKKRFNLCKKSWKAFKKVTIVTQPSDSPLFITMAIIHRWPCRFPRTRGGSWINSRSDHRRCLMLWRLPADHDETRLWSGCHDDWRWIQGKEARPSLTDSLNFSSFFRATLNIWTKWSYWWLTSTRNKSRTTVKILSNWI